MTGRGSVPSGAWWAAAIVAVSLVLALALSAHPERLEGVRSAGTDSYSYSLLGHRALYTFLERSGFGVARLRTRRLFVEPESVTALLVAEPIVSRATLSRDSSTSRSAIVTFSVGRPTVLVLPKWDGEPDESNPSWLHAMVLKNLRDVALAAAPNHLPASTLVRGGDDSLRCATAWGESLSVAAPRLQWLQLAGDAVPIVWRDSRVLVARFTSATPFDDEEDSTEVLRDTLYVISDPDLLNNRGLGRADHARLIRRFFAEQVGAHRVLFDEGIHLGVVSHSLAAVLLGFPLVLLFAQAIVLLVFLAWGASERFGAPVVLAPRPAGGAALIDTAADLLSAAGRPEITLQVYWEEVLREVAGRYARATARTRAQLLADVAELSRARGARADVRELEREVEQLQRTPERPGAIAPAARRIHGWYEEMIHGR